MATLREVQRVLRMLVPAAPVVAEHSDMLEVQLAPTDPPHTRACVIIEGDRLGARELPGEPSVGFTAFLDGVQESRAVTYIDGIPLVWGRVAAAIRVRADRRMSTWAPGHQESTKLYAPAGLFPDTLRDTLGVLGFALTDTLGGQPPQSIHPYELLRLAVHAVQSDRERLEREMAESWCSGPARPLYVDGRLPWGERASRSICCVGVVKSHHTIYSAESDIKTVFSLAEGMRTSVFVLERDWGPTVASWYLRLRGTHGHDPMWGLVRVEVAMQPGEPLEALFARADEVSRWILAERTPLSLPDGRWHAMAYGVRDCEEFLRAVAK